MKSIGHCTLAINSKPLASKRWWAICMCCSSERRGRSVPAPLPSSSKLPPRISAAVSGSDPSRSGDDSIQARNIAGVMPVSAGGRMVCSAISQVGPKYALRSPAPPSMQTTPSANAGYATANESATVAPQLCPTTTNGSG